MSDYWHPLHTGRLFYEGRYKRVESCVFSSSMHMFGVSSNLADRFVARVDVAHPGGDLISLYRKVDVNILAKSRRRHNTFDRIV